MIFNSSPVKHSDKQHRILHIAVTNIAGFPYDFCQMHNSCGDYARLVTLHKSGYSYPEDICLNLKQPKGKLAKLWHRKKENDQPPLVPPCKQGGCERKGSHCKQGGCEKGEDNFRKTDGSAVTQIPEQSTTCYFYPRNIAEKYYFALMDRIRSGKVEKVIKENNLDDFDIVIYDSGLDFYRNSKQAIKWKKEGKKIVCCYYGSDLRVRGIIKEMEEISDLNITAEYDHLNLKSDLEFIFYPYDNSELKEFLATPKELNKKIRIVHSPTNRLYKGTNLILKVIENLKRVRDFEFILLENRPRSEVLKIKSTCDLGIECIGGFMGNTGYGKSGLEMLALGLPVVTSMPSDYAKWLPENPFVIANTEDELYLNLLELLDNPAKILERGEQSRKWVNRYHGFESVNRRLYELFEQYEIV